MLLSLPPPPIVTATASPVALVDTIIAGSDSLRARFVGLRTPPSQFSPREALDYLFDQFDAGLEGEPVRLAEFCSWARGLSAQDAGIVVNWYRMEERRELLVTLWRHTSTSQREELVDKFYPGLIGAVRAIDRILNLELAPEQGERDLRVVLSGLHPSQRPVLELAYNLAAKEPDPITQPSVAGARLSLESMLSYRAGARMTSEILELKGFDAQVYLQAFSGDPESAQDNSDWPKLIAAARGNSNIAPLFNAFITLLEFDTVERVGAADKSDQEKAAMLAAYGPKRRTKAN